MVLSDTTKTLITACLLSLFLMPGLGLTVTANLKDAFCIANDTNAVHKWEPWDNDLNVTGTGRFPYIKIGGMEIPYELTLAGFENLITGIFALVNSTGNKYGFTSMVTSDDPGNPIPSGLFLNYGTHSENGGASVLGVWRMCNVTDTGYCNTGPLADFGDFSNTLFPNAAMSVASDAPASPQILRLNGYLLDPGSKMIYLANTANTIAITADNGDLVCTNLNADMVDSEHATDFVTITGDQYITGSLGLSDNMTAAYFMGDGRYLTNLQKADNATYADDSNTTDGYHLNQDVLNTSDVKFDSIVLDYGLRDHGGYTPYGITLCDSYSAVKGCGGLYYDQYLQGTTITGKYIYLNPSPNWMEIFSRTRVYDDIEPDNSVSNTLSLGDNQRFWNKLYMGSGGISFSNSTSITQWTMNSDGTDNDMNLFNSSSTSKLTLQQDGSFYVPGVYDDSGAEKANVYVASDGQLYRATVSSETYKENVRDLEIDTKKLYELVPKSYEYGSQLAYQKNNPSLDRTSFGLIAEEVDKILPELVIREREIIQTAHNETECFDDPTDENPSNRYCENSTKIVRSYGKYEPVSVNYELLSVLLLKEVQRLNTVCKLNGLKGCS